MALGRYELLVPIGVGGMACVWAAKLSGHGGFSRLVAIKTVLPHLNHLDFEDMLLDEARIAGGTHHPNVCDLLDVGKDQGVVYLVLEWVNGDSLLHLLRGTPLGPHGPLDYGVAARIVADGCAGLHAAHELTCIDGRPLGVVHRDVSPHNLLVSLEGVTKIADFGVAKAQGQLHQSTRAGEIRGKLAYMAPEQAGGGTVDRRADVFAMGCVLYQATLGRAPFCGENDAQIIRAVMAGSYEVPRQADPHYPPALAAIVGRALAHDPNRRYPTAEALRSALEDWLASVGSPTTMHVAAMVRERIGSELDERNERVQAALAAMASSDSTRPVARWVDRGAEPAREEGGIELPPAHAPVNGAASRLLPPGPAPVQSWQPALADASGAARPLKMAIAVILGLVLAACMFLARALLTGARDAGAAAAHSTIPSALPLAVLTQSSPAVVELAPPAPTVSAPAARLPSSPPTRNAPAAATESTPRGSPVARPAPTPVASGRPREIPANPY
jgi:serine/threonine-protein kinase